MSGGIPIAINSSLPNGRRAKASAGFPCAKGVSRWMWCRWCIPLWREKKENCLTVYLWTTFCTEGTDPLSTTSTTSTLILFCGLQAPLLGSPEEPILLDDPIAEKLVLTLSQHYAKPPRRVTIPARLPDPGRPPAGQASKRASTDQQAAMTAGRSDQCFF
jgi:hypothetical protein